jgi:hypothetical protein
MQIDPHTIQQILLRIEQQMRCPQCGKRVPVQFSSVRIAGDDFLILQLKCETCDAYIVLHATLQGTHTLGVNTDEERMQNASTSLDMSRKEISMLREALTQSGGNFATLFEKFVPKKSSPKAKSGPTVDGM